MNRYKSKEKSKLEIKDLLEQILINETILNEDIKQRIQQQINNYWVNVSYGIFIIIKL